MIASEFLSTNIFPLKKNDSVEDAILLMHDWNVTCLPVVDAGVIIGYASLPELTRLNKKDKLIHHLKQGVIQLGSSQIHLFEILKLFSEHALSTISIVEQDNFVGIISKAELVEAYKNSSLLQPGAIIQLQMSSRNYSLSEISRLIESNDVKIIHMYIKSLNDDEGHIEVSLKLNSNDIKNVLTTLERYQYQITGVFNASETDDNMKVRFDNLIKYLNI